MVGKKMSKMKRSKYPLGKILSFTFTVRAKLALYSRRLVRRPTYHMENSFLFKLDIKTHVLAWPNKLG